MHFLNCANKFSIWYVLGHLFWPADACSARSAQCRVPKEFRSVQCVLTAWAFWIHMRWTAAVVREKFNSRRELTRNNVEYILVYVFFIITFSYFVWLFCKKLTPTINIHSQLEKEFNRTFKCSGRAVIESMIRCKQHCFPSTWFQRVSFLSPPTSLQGMTSTTHESHKVMKPRHTSGSDWQDKQTFSHVSWAMF